MIKKITIISLCFILSFAFLDTLKPVYADNGIDDIEIKFDGDSKIPSVNTDFKQDKNIKTKEDIAKHTFKKMDFVFQVFSGIAMLLSIAFFSIHFMRMQSAAGNVSRRAEESKAILYLGIGTAILGGFGFLFPMLVGFLR